MSTKTKIKELIQKRLKEISATGTGASFTAGTGANYATPYAFNPNKKAKGAKNIYYYKLGFKPVNQKALNKAAKGIEVKQLWEADFDVNQLIKDQNITNPAMVDWISKRVESFDTLERQLNQLIPMLQQAKKETIRKYSQDPSFAVIYGTDLAQEYLQDIIELFKQPE